MTGQFFKTMGAAAATALAMVPALAFGQEAGQQVPGYAEPGQYHLQPSVTPIMDSIVSFHDGILMWSISLIVVLVLALLVWVVVRYNAKSNPNPNPFTHNTLVEIVWTVAPIIVLIIIAITYRHLPWRARPPPGPDDPRPGPEPPAAKPDAYAESP